MKKLYISLLGLFFILFSSSVFANCNFDGSTFEQERKEAYFWSCNEWIIYEQYINDAKLNQELSRIEMARMLNIFAMKLMWKEEDPSKDCKWYSDLNYNDSIIANRACHLWIMWIGIDKFRPKDSVSRAEFWTVLSRILYWNTYNVTNWKYYEKHLKALKDNGVITNTNPNLKEKKWYVLLMLKRYIYNKEKQSIKEEISYKSDGWYIMRNWTYTTFSDNKNSISIGNDIKRSKDWYSRSDSLQWPCAPWYHVPSKDEVLRLIDIWMNIRWKDLYNVKKAESEYRYVEWIVQNWEWRFDLEWRAIWDILLSDISWRETKAWDREGSRYRTRSINQNLDEPYLFIISTNYYYDWSNIIIEYWWKKTKRSIICFKN